MFSTRHTWRKAAGITAGIAVAALALTACSGGGGGSDEEPAEAITQEDIDEAMTTPTELTFWTWVPDIENQVDLFEEAYPAIDVKVENVGQGAAHYQKLRSAIAGRRGRTRRRPDRVPVHPVVRARRRSLLDLTPYGADDTRGRLRGVGLEPGARPDDEVWAIPQDVGPMGNLYREDILAAAGITEPPAT